MIRKMKSANYYIRETYENEYCETLSRWTKAEPIEIFIYVSNGSIEMANTVQSIASTHYGLTYDSRDIKAGDMIELDGNYYNIEYVSKLRRMRQLNMECQQNVSINLG